MDASHGTERFRQADALFQAGNHAQALAVLIELNREWPGQPNVLLPMALCMERLGRPAAALHVARMVLEKGEHPRARQLLNHLLANTPTQAPVPPVPDPQADLLRVPDLFGPPPPRATPKPAPAPWTDWRVVVAVAGVLLLLAVLVAPLFSNPAPPVGDAVAIGGAGSVGETGPALAAGGATLGWGLLLAGLGINVLLGALVLYMALSLMGKLLHDEVAQNLTDVLLVSLVTTLLAFIPLVGWIIALWYLARHYDLSLVELIGLVLLMIVVAVAAGFVLFLVFVGLAAAPI
jgi:hypothetical protein